MSNEFVFDTLLKILISFLFAGRALYESGNFSAALKVLLDASKSYSKMPTFLQERNTSEAWNIHIGIGHCYMKLGNVRMAEEKLKHIRTPAGKDHVHETLGFNIHEATLTSALGDCCYHLKKFDQAKKYYNDYFKLLPTEVINDIKTSFPHQLVIGTTYTLQK